MSVSFQHRTNSAWNTVFLCYSSLSYSSLQDNHALSSLHLDHHWKTAVQESSCPKSSWTFLWDGRVRKWHLSECTCIVLCVEVHLVATLHCALMTPRSGGLSRRWRVCHLRDDPVTNPSLLPLHAHSAREHFVSHLWRSRGCGSHLGRARGFPWIPADSLKSGLRRAVAILTPPGLSWQTPPCRASELSCGSSGVETQFITRLWSGRFSFRDVFSPSLIFFIQKDLIPVECE